MSERLLKVKINQISADRVKAMVIALGVSEEKITSAAIQEYWKKMGPDIRKYFEQLDQGSALFCKSNRTDESIESGISDKLDKP